MIGVFIHFVIAMAQDITIPEFDGNSFLELKLTTAPGRSMSLEVWFLAKDPNGKKPLGTQMIMKTSDTLCIRYYLYLT